MPADSIIGDIHQFREEYATRFNNDLKAICNDARSKQGHDGREVVAAHPKPAQMLRTELKPGGDGQAKSLS
jgi:hypothetical protein